MSSADSARLDILPVWAKLNDMLIELVDYVPDDKIEWSPTPELWSFHHIFLHLSEAREQWMNRAIDDGETDIDVYENVHSRHEIKTAFASHLAAHRARIQRSGKAGRDLSRQVLGRCAREEWPLGGVSSSRT